MLLIVCYNKEKTKEATMLFFYVRHGDPIYNPDSLTPLGHEQAKALSKRFLTYGLDRVFASPSVRAMQTAQPTCDLLGKEMTICPWADEGLAHRDFGIDTPNGGRSWCFFHPHILEIFRSPEVYALGQSWYEHPDLVKEFGIKQAPTLTVVENGSFTNYKGVSDIKKYIETL